MQTFFEVMGGTYRQEGDYLLPNIEATESPKIGNWGERRRRYLREHRRALYTAMMLSDTLNTHLEEVDHTAAELHDRLVTQMAEQESITEQLKSTNQIEWVQRMNNIRTRAAEVIWKELICV